MTPSRTSSSEARARMRGPSSLLEEPLSLGGRGFSPGTIRPFPSGVLTPEATRIVFQKSVRAGAFFAVVSMMTLLICCLSVAQRAGNDRIHVVPNEADRRVDISIDGQPFTSYVWPTTL